MDPVYAKQDDLNEQAGITDTWLVFSKRSIDVDTVTTERNWLYGTQSNKYALVLHSLFADREASLHFKSVLPADLPRIFPKSINVFPD